MTSTLQRLSGGVAVEADNVGLSFWCGQTGCSLDDTKHWPPEALATPIGLRTAIQVEQCLEMGLAHQSEGRVCIDYADFADIHSLNLELTRAWTEWSPFLLQIDRTSDIGRRDFRYQYRFRLGANEVPLERLGYYVRRLNAEVIYHLDDALEARNVADGQHEGQRGDRPHARLRH